MHFRKAICEHKLATILVAGILVRLLLMPISAHPFDVYAWYLIMQDITENGPFNLQNFPPLWGHYFLVPVSYLYSWLAQFLPTGTIPMSSISPSLDFYPDLNIQVVPGVLFNFIVKLPFFLSDVIVTFLLYKIVVEKTGKKEFAEKAALLWFLNPFLIWVSAVWGMWDTLPVIFSIVALYFLVKNRVKFSGFFLGLGVAAKLYPLLFLVPFTFYIFKHNSKCERWQKSKKFYLPFIGVSLLLFLPYFGFVADFFNSYFLPGGSGGSDIGFDPVLNPIGFGLTYWSISLLNRIISLPFDTNLTTLLPALSIILVGVFLIIVYWKTSKLSFRKPYIDLTMAMLISIVAVFLSYRVICEQFYVWILPFLIILHVGGNLKNTFYWGASLTALLYSVLNCPLPFYFLPLAPWAQNQLLSLTNMFLSAEYLRIIFLVVLGCIFSFLMFQSIIKLKHKNSKGYFFYKK
jgi:hypothetical protein